MKWRRWAETSDMTRVAQSLAQDPVMSVLLCHERPKMSGKYGPEVDKILPGDGQRAAKLGHTFLNHRG